jgi:hypothetical protein
LPPTVLPVQGIYLIKQLLKGIIRRRGDLHGLSRSAISAIEELVGKHAYFRRTP